jgi:hypothetical protein
VAASFLDASNSKFTITKSILASGGDSFNASVTIFGAVTIDFMNQGAKNNFDFIDLTIDGKGCKFYILKIFLKILVLTTGLSINIHNTLTNHGDADIALLQTQSGSSVYAYGDIVTGNFINQGNIFCSGGRKFL